MIQSLTNAENEVIQLKALGFIEKEIADKRCVSIHTIKTQVKRALKKSGARSCYELVARYALSNPDLFKHAIVAVFITIQGLICISVDNYDMRKPMKNRAKQTRTYRARS